MKTCILCNTEKSLDQFYACAKSRDKKGSYCRPCANEYQRLRVQNSPEAQAKRKQYNREHTDETRAARRVWRAKNHADVLAYGRKYYQEKPEKALLYEARKRAKEFGLNFLITEDDIKVPEFCPILGVKLVRGSIENNRDCCPSLDRVEPSRGYVPGNIAVISYRANRIKNDATAEEHRKIAAWMDSFGTQI